MKTLLEKFEEAEFAQLVEVKLKTGLNWHDFILKKCLKE